MAKNTQNIVLELTPAEAELVSRVFRDGVLWQDTKDAEGIWSALAKVGVYGDGRKIELSKQYNMFVDAFTV
jgi:hypothetical protein